MPLQRASPYSPPISKLLLPQHPHPNLLLLPLPHLPLLARRAKRFPPLSPPFRGSRRSDESERKN
jgi:hypothetical protein